MSLGALGDFKSIVREFLARVQIIQQSLVNTFSGLRGALYGPFSDLKIWVKNHEAALWGCGTPESPIQVIFRTPLHDTLHYYYYFFINSYS